jgi:thioredoxin
MKKLIIISALLLGFSQMYSQKVTFLDKYAFKENIWNYEQNASWNYKGNKPVIIDFYADRCKPCKMLSPRLVEIQQKYGDKIQVYKIDTDKNPELSQLFNVRSIPTLLFIPADGNYKQVLGYKNNMQFEKLISDILKIEKL